MAVVMIKNISLLICLVILTGCAALKNMPQKMATTAAATTIGAMTAGIPGAVVASALGDATGDIIFSEELEKTAKTVEVIKKVDSAWSLLARLGEVAGWIIGAVLLIPLILGYLIPSPHKKKE